MLLVNAGMLALVWHSHNEMVREREARIRAQNALDTIIGKVSAMAYVPAGARHGYYKQDAQWWAEKLGG